MRLLLAILAVFGLLTGPVTAAAAQAACNHASSSATMAVMDMPGVGAADGHKGARPCCDQPGQQKHSDKNCAKSCAAICGAAIAVLSSPSCTLSPSLSKAEIAAPMLPARSYEPKGPERPPKSIV